MFVCTHGRGLTLKPAVAGSCRGSRPLKGLKLALLGGFLYTLAGLVLPAADIPQISDTNSVVVLNLDAYLQRVVEHNENLQMRALEWLASQKRLKAAKGIFEPELVSSIERVSNLRRNTAERMLSMSYLSFFDEDNTLYSNGIEVLSPTGAKVRLGSTMRDMANNLQRNVRNGRKEFETFAGISVVQPLMKNTGLDATMAAIRLAAGESELAYQEYRRQMMMTLARAEAAYWDLYLAQEQDRIRQDSVRVAETLLRDNRERLTTGKVAPLDVLQAEAGVALRQARRNDARQKVAEGMNRLVALFSGASAYSILRVLAADRPVFMDVDVNYFDNMSEALDSNPDFLGQRRQVTMENIRVAYAQNQRWPQLDLKASYGLNGLGPDMREAWRDIVNNDYENWSVGVELRLPLGGGSKGRNELAAAKLRQREALLALKSAESEIANAMGTSIHHITSYRESVTNYQTVVQFGERLLETELARLAAGKTESRKVLEIEESLSEARNTALETLTSYQKAIIEWKLVRGAILKARNLELTQRQLESKTASYLRTGQWVDLNYTELRNQAKQEFEAVVLRPPQAPAAPATPTLPNSLTAPADPAAPAVTNAPPLTPAEREELSRLLWEKIAEMERAEKTNAPATVK